jgi:hypothetical protein
LNKEEAVLHRAQIREWASAEGKLFVASVRTYHIETQSDRRVFTVEERERERSRRPRWARLMDVLLHNATNDRERRQAFAKRSSGLA